MRAAFNLFDEDQNGHITLDEFKKAFGLAEEDDHEWVKLFHEADQDKNGTIEFDEFKQICI